MSKMGQYVFQMEEDAQWMPRDQWVKVYGMSNIQTYDRFHGPDDARATPELREVVNLLDEEIQFLSEAQNGSQMDSEIRELQERRNIMYSKMCSSKN